MMFDYGLDMRGITRNTFLLGLSHGHFDHWGNPVGILKQNRREGTGIISSCAHAGIVNTVKHVQKISGMEKVHAVMGGFHLIGAPFEKIQRTVSDIKGINPDFVIPMHCTGWEAITTFEREMPKQFILNTAGTTYTFEP